MKRPLKRLDTVHQKLIDTIATLDARVFSERPSKDEWSVAEIVQHLCLVEERVIKDLERALAREPQSPTVWKKLIPAIIVSSRLLRVKAPKAVNPITVPEKYVAIQNFNSARETLKTLCATHGKARFRQIIFKHPFLGDIDGVKTIAFVGYHEHRHFKQIREVLKKVNGRPRIRADKRGSE